MALLWLKKVVTGTKGMQKAKTPSLLFQCLITAASCWECSDKMCGAARRRASRVTTYPV